MLVNGREGTEAEAFADFFERWRILVRLHEIGDEVVNLPLTLGDCHEHILGEYKAKSRATNFRLLVFSY